MGGVNLDEPGFTDPAGSAPSSSDSSAYPPPESRSKCVSCPRRMSAKTADRHTICVACRRFDCSIDTRCEESIDWPEEDVRLYAKMRKSLKSKGSSKRRDKSAASPPPPPAESVPSSQPDAIANMQTQVDSLNALVNFLSDSFFARMDALQSSIVSSLLQSSSRPSHRPDASTPQPGVTTDESRMFQAMGESCRKTGESHSLGQVTRPPRTELFILLLPHSLVRLRVQILSLQLSFLRLLSHPRPDGPPQGLLLLALVVRGHPQSRRLVTQNPCRHSRLRFRSTCGINLRRLSELTAAPGRLSSSSV